jgi:acetyl-CoA C-acetyltransferase
VGASLQMTSPEETALGLTDPVQVYPMFEQALRRHTGYPLEQQIDVAAELWSRFSDVAATNPFAAVPRRHSPEEIRTPGPTNRMIGSPYPKLMNANSSVDQGAALLLCSAGRAEQLGVPRERWVFLHGAAEGDDTPFVSERPDLGRSPAIELVGRTALEMAGVGVDDLAYVDLYSCFPSAVQVSAAALGLPLDRALTVTGGLTFGGGPWNNYVSHSIATMVGILRETPEAYGLCSANGGLLTKHAVGVYSCRPVVGGPDRGARVRSVREDLARLVQRRRAAPDFCGTASVESWTVMHDRVGQPQRAYAFALLEDGRRTLATSEDPALVATLARHDVLGAPAAIRSGALMEVG